MKVGKYNSLNIVVTTVNSSHGNSVNNLTIVDTVCKASCIGNNQLVFRPNFYYIHHWKKWHYYYFFFLILTSFSLFGGESGVCRFKNYRWWNENLWSPPSLPNTHKSYWSWILVWACELGLCCLSPGQYKGSFLKDA